MIQPLFRKLRSACLLLGWISRYRQAEQRERRGQFHAYYGVLRQQQLAYLRGLGRDAKVFHVVGAAIMALCQERPLAFAILNYLTPESHIASCIVS